MDCHGVTVAEVKKNAQGVFEVVVDSTFNRRITGTTEIELSGPARGNPLFVTKFSPNGTKTRGTMNNCGNGKTLWGTLLTTEENWSGYYFRAAGDQAKRRPSRRGPIEQACGQVRDDVIDRHDRLAERPGHALGRAHAHEQAADQAGAVGHTHAVEV